MDTTPEQKLGARLQEETVRHMGDTAVRAGSPDLPPDFIPYAPYECPLTLPSTHDTPVDPPKKRGNYKIVR